MLVLGVSRNLDQTALQSVILGGTFALWGTHNIIATVMCQPQDVDYMYKNFAEKKSYVYYYNSIMDI